MNSSFDSTMAAALWIAARASALVGAAAIVHAVFSRRMSAASRHLLWSLVIAGVLALPVLSVTLPEWIVVIRTEPIGNIAAPPVLDMGEEPQAAALSSAAVETITLPVPVAQPGVSLSWPALTLSVYVMGVIGLMLHSMMQWRRVRRLARAAVEVRDPEWTGLLRECTAAMRVRRRVTLLRGREGSMPMAFGTHNPAILLPATADIWPVDRRRAVLLHELAHVARYDCLTQTLALAARAMYWFHPAMWWAARQLRIERELACDDRVIGAGAPAREYAGHLLEIAYSFSRHRAPALAVAMARPRQLEGRMIAVLDEARNRRVPAMRVRVAAAMVTAACLLFVAPLRTAVVEAESKADGPVSPTAEAPVSDQDATGPHLKAVDIPLRESARLIANTAAALFGAAQELLPGTWEIRPTSTEGVVSLRLVEVNSSSSSHVPLERLEGLTAAQLAGAGGPVEFRMRRDAGTFTFEGVLRNGVGAGTFSFARDPNFAGELARRGFRQPTAREQYQLARHDVGYAFVDELSRQGYKKPDTADLVRAGQHGVHLTYLREMGELGYKLGSLDPLIKLRDHGVTPAYIRELASQGYKGLSADDVQRARDHGISPEYVRAMGEAGYRSLPMDDLIRARDHGVSAEFVRDLAAAGHRTLPLSEVIRARDHGVSSEYLREMRQLGYAIPLDELVQARDHGVSVEFVREMVALGYVRLPIESLIRLRDHGVSAKYVQDLKSLGYEKLAVEDLVMLRDHGLSADRIRAANARAGTRLPIDLLKSLAAGGMR